MTDTPDFVAAWKQQQAAAIARCSNAFPTDTPELNVWREASDAASENAVKWKPAAEERAAAVIRTYGDQRDADAYQRGKLEGARLAIEVADRAATRSIAAHCTEIGLGTYFRRGDALRETSQGWKLQRVEALVREMRDLPSQSIRALDPAKIVGEG